MILIIDNYDSFTFNLVQGLGALPRNPDIRVVRHDVTSVDEIEELRPSHMVISPGPGAPAQAGISIEVIQRFAERVPILGVCLGHQCIGAAFGMRVRRAPRLLHGKTSAIHHVRNGLYEGLPNPFTAARYHSLILRAEDLPDDFEPTAWTKEGELMGLRHRHWPLEGVQFHPESFMTEAGSTLLENFVLRRTSAEQINPVDTSSYRTTGMRSRI